MPAVAPVERPLFFDVLLDEPFVFEFCEVPEPSVVPALVVGLGVCTMPAELVVGTGVGTVVEGVAARKGVEAADEMAVVELSDSVLAA